MLLAGAALAQPRQEYEDFRLRFEYKLAQWAEAAVVVRAPADGRLIPSGIAIFLAHDFHENVTPYVTGAIAGVLPPRKRLPTSFDRWHTASVEIRTGRLKAVIDGVLVQDLDIDSHPELRYRLKRGYIVFPDLGHKYEVRNVHVEDLGGREKFVDLRDVASWGKRGETGSWTESDGVIEGANGHSIVYAPPVLRDFEFTALVRSHDRVNAGVFLRGSPAPDQRRGFEVQIYSQPDSVYPTGSVYAKQRALSVAEYEGRWFLMQIRVEGSRCLVRLDGHTVADYDGLAGADLQPGRVGLQIHSDVGRVQFRDVRVRALTATDRAASPAKAR